MKLPDKVNVLGIEYSIEYVNKLSEVDIYKRESLWGQIDFWTRTIRIYEKDRANEDVWETVFHEVLHAIDEHLKLNLFKGEDAHDSQGVLALALADTFFRNEWMK